jgi:DNA-binding GntR family transcriptional regulator
MTAADLKDLDEAERRFAELTTRVVGGEALTGDWVRANHAFHDVIYRVANAPMIERIAKNARRTFSGQAVWGSGRSDIDELYEKNVRQHRAIAEALAAGSASGARSLAREHVLSSFGLLEAVLNQVERGGLRRLA